MTMAKVTRKNAMHESTIIMAISQESFSAVEPASDHNLSREMHLEMYHLGDILSSSGTRDSRVFVHITDILS